ncbi:DNA primase [Streptomyces sp. NPDC006365]|uniref:DNA primase n=1 Tax=Streptomyces sp. NPDC006365 TaxID=3364744 RepID=UPI0036B59E23
MNRVGLGLAVGAGYVLGRTKKMKMAFAVGSLVAGKRMNLSPRALANLVNEQLQNNPQVKEIGDQLREDLSGVGKAASGALVERRIDALADRLHGRTEQVRGQLAGVTPDVPGLRDEEEPEDEREESEEEESEEEASEEEASEEEASEEEASEEPAEAEGESEEPEAEEREEAEAEEPQKGAAKKAAKKAPGKKPASKGPARKAPAKKTAGKKTAAKSAKKAPAKKTAARGRAAEGRQGR